MNNPEGNQNKSTATMTDTTLRENNKKLIAYYLKLLEDMNIEAWIELWAEDGMQEMPYHPEGFPACFDGKQALFDHFRQLREEFSSMRFPISNLQTLEDPEWVLAEYHGEITVKAGGSYNNRYCVLFHIRDGEVVLSREYFNPTVLTGSSHYGDISAGAPRKSTE